MEFQRVGKSGLQVSKIILGGMSFGKTSWGEWIIEDEEEIFKLLKYSYDKGIRTWDTASIYSFGESERLIGKFLKKYNIDRSTVVLLTKVFFGDSDYENRKFDEINNTGLSRKHILDGVDKAVERLGTYIDVLQIHRFDYRTDKEEIMCALNDVVKSGKVHYLGASTMRAVEFAQLQFIAEKHNWTKFISMQGFYNLLYREEEREMIPFCNETGVGLIPWSALALGVLCRPLGDANTIRAKTSPYITLFGLGKNPGEKETIERVEEIAKKKGRTMAQVALAWALSKGCAPIVGLSSTKRIDEAIDSLTLKLTAEETKYLEELYLPHAMTGFTEL